MDVDVKDLIDFYGLDEHAVVLKPQCDFNKGIIGVSEDKCHIVYGYNKLCQALAESYKQYQQEHPEQDTESKTDEDFLAEAAEWVDVNTIPSIPYQGCYAPIIIYEI